MGNRSACHTETKQIQMIIIKITMMKKRKKKEERKKRGHRKINYKNEKRMKRIAIYSP